MKIQKYILFCLVLFYLDLPAQLYQEITPSSIGITHQNEVTGGLNSGIAFCDINNDYLEDMVFGSDGEIKIYINSGAGTFEDISIKAGVSLANTLAAGICTGDLNNDGYVDIIVYGKKNNPGKMFINNGNETFTEVSSSSGINIFDGIYDDRNGGYSIALGDVNLDGYLDMYITTHIFKPNAIKDSNGNVVGWNPDCLGDRLYINNGDLTFSELTDEYGLGGATGCSFSAIFTDVDKDGDSDLLVVNDFGAWHTSDKAYINNFPTPTFTEVSSTSGFDDAIYGMAISRGDYDKDGDLDYYKSNFAQNVLLNNNGGVFSDQTLAAGVGNSHSTQNPTEIKTSWGNGFTDCDNDGHLDILIATGRILFIDSVAVETFQSSSIYFNNGNGTFSDYAIQEGVIDTMFSRGLAYGDYNNDGFQDLVFCRNSFVENGVVLSTNLKPAIFLNNGNGNNWLKVKLEGTVNNRDAIGAHIHIHSSAGSWLHEINCGGESFTSQHSRVAHFGLSNTTIVDSLEVRWPGTNTPDQVFYNIDVNQFIHIKELDTVYNPITCYNGIKDGDEKGIDCGGAICQLCDCDSEFSITTNSKNLISDETFHYEDYKLFDANALLQVDNAYVEIYAGNYIEIKEGELLTINSGDILLDIEGCIIKDLCYYSSLCHIEGFDIDSIDTYSSARVWMEILLESIRNDFARPTIHGRNLYHSSAMMYDIWQVYHSATNTGGSEYLVNQNLNGFSNCSMNLSGLSLSISDLDEAIAFGMAKLLQHRFSNSPAISITTQNIFGIFQYFGFDETYTGTNYASGNAADIGNYIAQCYIDYGLQDGSNEINDYSNNFYAPINNPLVTLYSGNSNMIDPSRWQPLTLDVFIDQSGNEIPTDTPDFLSPEWGEVHPFAMTSANKTTKVRDGNTYQIYHDPNTPPLLLPSTDPLMSDEYKWGFLMVSIWGSHLDKNDPTMIDISPRSVGNNTSTWPTDFYGLPSFYNYFNGGDYPSGHATNPVTGSAYASQIVKRGDYGRVLAEFWADGPESETPPGHWFTILNYVNDHPLFVKKFEGTGPVIDDLQWDVKSYFTLGGAMHDAAVTAWSVKGYYDYVRPVSAIRFMADKGQSSDSNLPNYSIKGIPLEPGYCELVLAGDPLVGANNEHLNKIKLYSWKGPDYINNPEIDEAGVGWILAENWWPYQRPSFVTPPFAGYVSGHSTFSRAAAEVMTNLTGDAFFPGGMGEFHAPMNEFLVFEEGPSQDITLQWATYRDASDQCSLSRIWGGIHPPADDIPGRIMGEQIGIDAFNHAKNVVGF